MKLKKTRKARNCYSCKSSISKGDLYGQKSIALGSKVNGQSETAESMYTVVHHMRIPVDMCQACLEG
tara:strand:- start:17 stop:217 length:201 start_codon:yes stop_codon:yes gene_type:complete